LYYANCCSWTGDYVQALPPALNYLSITSSFTSFNKSAKEVVEKILRKLPPAYVSQRIAELAPSINKRNPNAAFFFALGDVLDTVGMHSDAILQYRSGLGMEKSYSMDNDDFRHAFARGFLRLGMDLEGTGRNYDRALRCYDVAYRLFPQDHQIDMHLTRLKERCNTRANDLAWNLKDWMAGLTQASAKGE
jgi:tetratricopeptide (TPR) repeat protein